MRLNAPQTSAIAFLPHLVIIGVDAFVKSVFGKIENPLIINAKGARWNKIPFNGKTYSTRELEQLYRNTEYDGIIIKNVIDYSGSGSLPSTVYIQYNPNQIKSATDTNYVTDSVPFNEKETIFEAAKKINKAKRTLIDTGDGLYLTDHTDKEGLYYDNEGNPKGFQVKLWVDTREYTKEEIELTKKEIENGTLRNQEDVDSWTKEHIGKQGQHNSDSIVVEVRRSDVNNVRLHNQTLEGESIGGRSDTSSQENQGESRLIKTGHNGDNSPRYMNWDNEAYWTSLGELYGFVDPKDNLYLDRRVITAEHSIHEYTHIWDRYVFKKNPELWKTGVEIWFGDWLSFNKVNPYSSEITLGEVTMDYDSADMKGAGALIPIEKNGKVIGGIALNAYYK